MTKKQKPSYLKLVKEPETIEEENALSLIQHVAYALLQGWFPRKNISSENMEAWTAIALQDAESVVKYLLKEGIVKYE
jgi:hypothetical protein